MSELIDVYEWLGDKLKHIGIMDKIEAEHKGIWHKISRVQPIKKINDEYYVILQRRGRHKRIGALNFAVAVSEHIKTGESDIDASIRGVKEELGINIGMDELEEAYSMNFEFDKGNIKERTYCTTHMLECSFELKDFILQKKEVEGVYMVPVKDMIDMFEGKLDKVEVTGIGLNQNETDYIYDVTTIDKNSFSNYNFYSEDFLKLKEYIENKSLDNKKGQVEYGDSVADDINFNQEID
ncbi:MAG TPA: hypothetical protein DCP90_03340 [Clostridiales bacterium]|nr:MAG: hypothetical protein A2Y22_03055 [Clostridiales bacterium GWD2_32_59]HAN09630.1 hypothetical protein [Clostridiales bacterium]